MRFRRHHNNKGLRRIKNGSTRRWADRMRRKLKLRKVVKRDDN